MFSSNFTDLLQILEIDKNKFQHFGPPRFRINIPCKYGNQCKYGRYSCEYSHEALCRFSKKGKKCLNSNCTYQHQLPVEYQLAQELLYLQMQISLESESLEAQNRPPHTIFQRKRAKKTARLNLTNFASKSTTPLSNLPKIIPTTILLPPLNLKTKRKLGLQLSARFSSIQSVQENPLQTIKTNYPAQKLHKHTQKWTKSHYQSVSLFLPVRNQQ